MTRTVSGVPDRSPTYTAFISTRETWSATVLQVKEEEKEDEEEEEEKKKKKKKKIMMMMTC